ncbi:hypothetical protein QE152_g6778 [Popillia japonica]|uniref:Copia protein n=1 Tax=Popillia japonica TaxID=7064 RepID=A0AAW1MG27_POPJA
MVGVTTPADPNAKLDGNKQPKEDVETEEIKNVPYQEAIGSLLFLCPQLEFRKDKEQFLDADWANELDDRRSITGNVIEFQHGAISWSSKKKETVALSTTEAEYMGLSTTCQEVLWLRMLAQEIDATAVSQPTIVYCDNKSAIDLAETSAYRQRTKHRCPPPFFA